MVFLRKHSFAAALIVDAAALIVFWAYIPAFRRPYDVLLGLLAVLCLTTAIAAGPGFARNFFVVLVSATAALFALEMMQKYLNVTNLVKIESHKVRTGGGRYNWLPDHPDSWLAVYETAKKDGALGDDFTENLPESASLTPADGLPVNRIFLRTDDIVNGEHVIECQGDRTPSLRGPPWGFHYRPDNRYREYVAAFANERIIHDGIHTINRFGFRETKGNPDGDVYIFSGCSFTYGMILDDAMTSAHYFSEATGWRNNVLNIAASGYGPNQALMDFEKNIHLGAAGVDPSRVKGVFYGLINHHFKRVSPPLLVPDAPYYLLADGRPVYIGPFSSETYNPGRLERILNSSRVYPVLASRIGNTFADGDLGDDWRLIIAILAELNRICRERYDVPLTVVYWDEDEAIVLELEKNGIDVVNISEALGDDWRECTVKFFLYDYHPSAHANKLLGRYLAKRAESAGNRGF